MNKLTWMIVPVIAGIGLFAAGWYCGNMGYSRMLASARETATTPLFDASFNQLSVTQAALEAIDAERLDDAKHQLRLNQDSNILALDHLWETDYAETRDGAEKLLARISVHRAKYPWKYTGTLPASNNPEIAAKVAIILKTARNKQLR
jgi:hypothetical protein